MDFFTGSPKRRRSTRRRSSSRRQGHTQTATGRVMNMTSPTGSQLRALENMMSRGPLTLVLVYSPTCPHCHTYMPMWKDLCKTQGRRANLVSMKADVYDKTPLSAKKTVTGVPSVLYVDREGHVTEAEDIRNQPLMKNVVKTASPNAEPKEPSSDLFRPSPPAPAAPAAAAEIKPVMPPPPVLPVAGSEARESALEPLPAQPVPYMQNGGNPWAAFLMSAVRQAAPAAALLGAYAALPKRSSGLPAARRGSRRKTRRASRRRHQ
jgi:hypothetical protein